MANSLLEIGQLPRLKALMLGGEVLSPDVAERILASGQVELLLNCYGPTECSMISTTSRCAAGAGRSTSPGTPPRS